MDGYWNTQANSAKDGRVPLTPTEDVQNKIAIINIVERKTASMLSRHPDDPLLQKFDAILQQYHQTAELIHQNVHGDPVRGLAPMKHLVDNTIDKFGIELSLDPTSRANLNLNAALHGPDVIRRSMQPHTPKRSMHM